MAPTRLKILQIASMLAALCCLSLPAGAGTLFFDDFENGLSAWNTTYGQIVTAPVDAQTHGQVVNFSSDKSGGDLQRIDGITPDPGTTCIFSFDYLGFGNAWGWAGINDDGTGMPSPHMWVVTHTDMTNDGSWHSYTYNFNTPWFNSDTVWLSFEQNDGTPGNCLLRQCADLRDTGASIFLHRADGGRLYPYAQTQENPRVIQIPSVYGCSTSQGAAAPVLTFRAPLHRRSET